MSSIESQERMKEEAKAIRLRLETLINDAEAKTRIVRMMCVYAGLLTETLLDYEEPDIVMEQAFHRIADLLQTDPASPDDKDDIVPLAYTVDKDTEIGRHLARIVAEKLPKGMDDLHEIAIALVINDVPVWEKDGFTREELLMLLIETVIMSLTFEMATQDFCDVLIEDFIADGSDTGEAITALAVLAGFYFGQAGRRMVLPADAQKRLAEVMVRESVRHGTKGARDWGALAASNDDAVRDGLPPFVAELKPEVEEFFALIGLDNPLGQAVAIAKAVGRMVAVITIEDVGHVHPSIAKSLAKTGLVLGAGFDEIAANEVKT